MSRNLVNPITGSLMPIAGYGQSGNFEGSWEEWDALTEAQKAQFRSLDINNDFNGMPIDEDLDPTSNHPVENQAIAKNIEAIVNVYGSKNLLPNNAVTTVDNGITYTVNSDGSVTVNGTASANTNILLANNLTLQQGQYILSGCPQGGDTESKYFLYLYTSNWSVNVPDIGNGALFNLNSITAGLQWRIYIRAGQVCNNLIFYPMIRDARITDPTYVPYAMTCREITESNKWESLTDITPSTTNFSDTGIIKVIRNSFSRKVRLISDGNIKLKSQLAAGSNVVIGTLPNTPLTNCFGFCLARTSGTYGANNTSIARIIINSSEGSLKLMAINTAIAANAYIGDISIEYVY